MYIIFDTETTGLPKNFNAPYTDTDNWPRCIQLAWQLHDENGVLIEAKDYIIKPNGFDIPFDAERIHGISTELANEIGVELLGQVPIEHAVAAGSDEGEPVAITGEGAAAQAFTAIAHRILETAVPASEMGGCSARSVEAVAVSVSRRDS
jgi:hypothetical protein